MTTSTMCPTFQNSDKYVHEQPLVSIIIPVYNREQYLKECIDSALNQTYSNIEIICINDGSTDKSLKILQDYQNKHSNIKLISQENKGVASACNTGIKNMNGDYVKWLGSDDILYPNCIEVFINCARNLDDPTYIIMCEYDLMDENSIVYGAYDLPNIDNLNDKEINVKLLCGIYPNGTGIMFMHKSAFKQHIFDESLLFGEDYDLLLKLCIWHKFKLHIISKKLLRGRKHRMSLQRQTNYIYAIKIMQNIRKNILNNLDESERVSYEKELKIQSKTIPLRIRFRTRYQQIMIRTIGDNNSDKILEFYRKIKYCLRL